MLYSDETVEEFLELSVVENLYICPICLDLLHEPYRTIPCRHTFCETCLRRLGEKDTMKTSCPMCRTVIIYCQYDKELSHTISSKYTKIYNRRRQFEDEIYDPFLVLPLPWRPGWRSLWAGKFLGGNSVPLDSFWEVICFSIHVLPYFIHPMLIANFINIILMATLFGAMGLLPWSPFQYNKMAENVEDPSLGRQLSEVSKVKDGGEHVDTSFYYFLIILSLISTVFGNLITLRLQSIIDALERVV